MLDELIDTTRRELEAAPVAYQAAIATAPDSAGRVMVTVREIAGRQLRLGPCPVQPRVIPGAGTHARDRWPVRGDRALVIRDQFSRPWIACWEPA